jgi:hypothetical protein
VRQICLGQHISKILRVSVIEKRRKRKLCYQTDAFAFAQRKEHPLGKRLLFTDQKSGSNEQMILAYRSQSQVESAFADRKDPHFLTWEPRIHWTDSKIRVHAFYCVLAFSSGSLLQRRAAENGLSLSLQALCKALNGIQEVTSVFPPAGPPGSPGRPHVKTTLTEMEDTQPALFRLLALDRHRHT